MANQIPAIPTKYGGTQFRSSADVIAQWREAGNRSQWRGPEAG